MAVGKLQICFFFLVFFPYICACMYTFTQCILFRDTGRKKKSGEVRTHSKTGGYVPILECRVRINRALGFVSGVVCERYDFFFWYQKNLWCAWRISIDVESNILAGRVILRHEEYPVEGALRLSSLRGPWTFFFFHPPSLSIEEKKQNTSPSFPCLLRLMLITVLLEWRQIYGENEYVHTGSNWPHEDDKPNERLMGKAPLRGPVLLDPLTWTESMRMKPINEFKSHLCCNSQPIVGLMVSEVIHWDEELLDLKEPLSRDLSSHSPDESTDWPRTQIDSTCQRGVCGSWMKGPINCTPWESQQVLGQTLKSNEF